MKIFNLLFYSTVFVSFVLPNNADFFVDIFGMQLQIREIGFIFLPIFNILSYPDNQTMSSRYLKLLLLSFLVSVFFSEILKIIIFNQSIGNIIKEIRIGLPLFSSILLLLFNLNVNIFVVWKILLITIFISGMISILSIFIDLPIYSEIDSTDLLSNSGGRFINANSSIGFIGIYLLINKNKKLFSPSFILFSFVLILLSTFSRTYLIILALVLLYYLFSKKFIKIISTLIISALALILSYTSSEQIQNQVNRRILSLLLAQSDLSSSVYENNREIIIDGAIARINEGYWLIGMPYNIPIFIWDKNNIENSAMSVTDTSIINVILRYGIIPLLFLMIVYVYMYYNNLHIYKYFFLCLFLISFNADTLFRQNSIFFLIIIYFYSIYEKTKIKNCGNC